MVDYFPLPVCSRPHGAYDGKVCPQNSPSVLKIVHLEIISSDSASNI